MCVCVCVRDLPVSHAIIFDDKMKSIFCANSPFLLLYSTFSLHTKIVSSRTKDFAVSCGAMNENRCVRYALKRNCVFVLHFSTISDDECQLTLYLSHWALGEFVVVRANKIIR